MRPTLSCSKSANRRRALPSTRREGRGPGKGRVVATSSITGPITGYPGWSNYGALKAGQHGFIKTAAIELKRYNSTDQCCAGQYHDGRFTETGKDYLNSMRNSIPLKRLANWSKSATLRCS
ncbi:SDR family NAD(P)-dependent oxidoreductase [Mesorhizobium sp. M0204]|uniref:SDR family NAD(P)-dependent oxidoreductase n=1 Tax=Mesorhizobium sp. M0204 TaxID=2956913 RepID=UPI00333C36D4